MDSSQIVTPADVISLGPFGSFKVDQMELVGGSAPGLPKPRLCLLVGGPSSIQMRRQMGGAFWSAPLVAVTVSDGTTLATAGAQPSAPEQLRLLGKLAEARPDMIYLILVVRVKGSDHAVLFAGSQPHAVQNIMSAVYESTSEGLTVDELRTRIRNASPLMAPIFDAGEAVLTRNRLERSDALASDPASLIIDQPLSTVVDYLGGEPRHPSKITRAKLHVQRAGILITRVTAGTTWRGSIEEVFRISPYEMRGISLGTHDRMKTVIREGGWAAAGYLVGGESGAIIAALAVSPGASRNQFLSIACERDGRRFTITVQAEPGPARLVVNHIQTQRSSVEMQTLPEIADLPHLEAVALQHEQIGILREMQRAGHSVRDPDQAPESSPAPDALEQLERLGDLHRAGALSDDEFADAKASLLRRI